MNQELHDIKLKNLIEKYHKGELERNRYELVDTDIVDHLCPETGTSLLIHLSTVKVISEYGYTAVYEANFCDHCGLVYIKNNY